MIENKYLANIAKRGSSMKVGNRSIKFYAREILTSQQNAM